MNSRLADVFLKTTSIGEA